MAIPGNRLNVAGAVASNKNRIDFIKTNESSLFGTNFNLPKKIIDTDIGSVVKTTGIDTERIQEGINSIGLGKQFGTLMTKDLSLSTSTVMNKAMDKFGQSASTKRMMSNLFGDCAFDGRNPDNLNGLLAGLIPAMANQQRCSSGLLSQLTTIMSGTTTPDILGRSLMVVSNNVKTGKGETFLKDLNLNADNIRLTANMIDTNSVINSLVDKSSMDKSRNPDDAYNIMTSNMDKNNTNFNLGNKMITVAKKSALNKTPDVLNNKVNKVSFNDVLLAKSYNTNKISNIFG